MNYDFIRNKRDNSYLCGSSQTELFCILARQLLPGDERLLCTSRQVRMVSREAVMDVEQFSVAVLRDVHHSLSRHHPDLSRRA